MAEPPGILVAWGTILDDTAAGLPVYVRRDADGRIIHHERVVSYMSVSVTRAPPADDDDEIELDLPAEHTPRLIATAMFAATSRALCAMYPYIRPFLLDNHGAAPLHLPLNGQVSDQSALSIGDEAPITRGTQDQAVWFHLHVLAATALCRDPEIPRPPPPPEAPPSRDYSCWCQFCDQATFYAPCCATVFCPRCSRPHLRHSTDCAARRMYLPVVPRYPRGMPRLPPAFLLRPHPTWRVWLRRSGQNYILCSYLDVEDNLYFRDWRGIDFCTTLFAKDSVRSWSWVLVLEYRIRPTGPVVINWRVYIHDRYATPALE